MQTVPVHKRSNSPRGSCKRLNANSSCHSFRLIIFAQKIINTYHGNICRHISYDLTNQCSVACQVWKLTFDFQDEVSGESVANEALGGDAPQVDLFIKFWRQTHSASCYCDAATGTQTALLQQLDREVRGGSTFEFNLIIKLNWNKSQSPVWSWSNPSLGLTWCWFLSKIWLILLFQLRFQLKIASLVALFKQTFGICLQCIDCSYLAVQMSVPVVPYLLKTTRLLCFLYSHQFYII